VQAQTDVSFWFAAPEVSVSVNSFDIPIVLRISTSNLPSTVTVSQPANISFIPIVVAIPANSTASVDLSASLNTIETKPPNTVLNYGIHIVATQQVTVYYEVVSSYCGCNPEIYALKGQNALGTYFLIPSQTYYNNSPSYSPVPYSSFNIIATDDGTDVTISPSNDIVGHTAGVPFVITLDSGQVYSATASSQAGALHLQGSVVNSTKPIAITYSDDLLMGPGGCADLAGDQIVPVNITGMQYIVARGGLNIERVAILGTQANTDIYLDGNPIPVANIGLGQTYEFTLANPSGYITSSNPVYCLHVSGNGCEIGAALLPQIECTGSNQVGFTRSSTVPFYLNLVVRTTSTGFFELNGNTTYITSPMFSLVPGTGGQWSFAHLPFNTTQVPVNAASIIKLTNGDVFQMGILNGDIGGGCSYGYFSDFNSLNPNAVVSDQAICIGDSVNLNASGGTIYSWSPTINLSNPTIANPVASPTITTTYTVTVTNAWGCSATDSVVVTVNALPVATSSNNTPLCAGQTLNLTSDGGTVYSWTGPDGFTSTAQNPSITSTTVANDGVYTCIVTNANGCKDTTQTTVVIHPQPSSTIAGTNLLCNGDGSGAANLTISSGSPGFTYNWSNGATTEDLSNLAVGNYTVTVSDNFGCTTTSTITITQPTAITVNLTAVNETCSGSCDGVLSSIVNGGVPPYAYSWTSGATTPIDSGLCAGNYTLTLLDSNNCLVVISEVINSSNSVDASGYANPLTGYTPASINFYFNGTGAATYVWTFGDGNSSTQQNPVYVYTSPGIYTVTLTINSGSPNFCEDTFTFTIEIFDPSSVSIPNVFTPNGDGFNDVFKVKSRGLETEAMSIFNRWGKKLFEWNTPDGAWDGKIEKSKTAADGVYFYIYIAKGFDKIEYNYTGTVTLIK